MATATGSWLASLRARLPHGAVAFVVGSLVAVAIAAYLHELTHQHIFAQFGCHSSIQWFPAHRSAIAVTQPASGCWSGLPPARSRALYRAQLLVEAVGYQLFPLYAVIGGGVGLLVAGQDDR